MFLLSLSSFLLEMFVESLGVTCCERAGSAAATETVKLSSLEVVDVAVETGVVVSSVIGGSLRGRTELSSSGAFISAGVSTRCPTSGYFSEQKNFIGGLKNKIEVIDKVKCCTHDQTYPSTSGRSSGVCLTSHKGCWSFLHSWSLRSYSFSSVSSTS